MNEEEKYKGAKVHAEGHFGHENLSLGEWIRAEVVITDRELVVYINGDEVARFSQREDGTCGAQVASAGVHQITGLITDGTDVHGEKFILGATQFNGDL